MNRIAIIHMGAIGDLVQTLPVLRAIRAKWPAARITLIGRPKRTALARMAGLADACLDFDSPASRAAAAEADLVVDFLSRPAPQAASPRAPQTVAVHPLPPADWTQSAAAWILRETSARLDLPQTPLEPEIVVPPAVMDEARGLLVRHLGPIEGWGGHASTAPACPPANLPLAVIHPGSGSPRKNWPPDRFAEIARRLGREAGVAVAWLLGPAETEREAAKFGMREKENGGGVREAFLENIPLETVAGVLALARVYVGNDSGATHLAAAVRGAGGQRVPTVALFGPSDARVWAPRGEHVRIVASSDGTMDGIDAERVWAAVKSAALS